MIAQLQPTDKIAVCLFIIAHVDRLAVLCYTELRTRYV